MRYTLTYSKLTINCIIKNEIYAHSKVVRKLNLSCTCISLVVENLVIVYITCHVTSLDVNPFSRSSSTDKIIHQPYEKYIIKIKDRPSMCLYKCRFPK